MLQLTRCAFRVNSAVPTCWVSAWHFTGFAQRSTHIKYQCEESVKNQHSPHRLPGTFVLIRMSQQNVSWGDESMNRYFVSICIARYRCLHTARACSDWTFKNPCTSYFDRIVDGMLFMRWRNFHAYDVWPQEPSAWQKGSTNWNTCSLHSQPVRWTWRHIINEFW